jgi:carboxyl-terminal processing protease
MNNRSQFDQYKTPTDMAKGYQNTADAWNKLVNFAQQDSINLAKIPEEDKKRIQQRIRAYLAKLKWRTQGFYEMYNTDDPIVLKAKQVLAQ